MRFPGQGDAFPTKDQIANYLVDYAQRFRLPIENNVHIDRLWKENDRFVMTAGNQRYESENVVVAMANYQIPRIPAFAQDLGAGIPLRGDRERQTQQCPREEQLVDVGARLVRLPEEREQRTAHDECQERGAAAEETRRRLVDGNCNQREQQQLEQPEAAEYRYAAPVRRHEEHDARAEREDGLEAP